MGGSEGGAAAPPFFCSPIARAQEDIPQRLKLERFWASCGTTEVVPFQNRVRDAKRAILDFSPGRAIGFYKNSGAFCGLER